MVAGETPEQSEPVWGRRKGALVGVSPASPGGTPGTPAVPALQHNRDGAVRGPAPAQGVTARVCERGRCLFVCAGFCSADPLCSPCRAIHQLWQPRQFQASAMPFLGGGDKAHFVLGRGAALSLLATCWAPSFPPQSHARLCFAPASGHRDFPPATSISPAAEPCSQLPGASRVPAASPARCALPACPEAPAITGSRQAVAACPAGSGQGWGAARLAGAAGHPRDLTAFPAALSAASGGSWALVMLVAHPRPCARLGVPRLAAGAEQ